MKLLCCATIATVMLTVGCNPSTNSQYKAPAPTVPNAPIPSKDEARAYHLEWNRKTLVTDYEQNGRRDPKWDAHARIALEAFAQLRSGSVTGSNAHAEDLVVKITEATGVAVTNGCDDPMIQYFQVRYILPQQEHEKTQHAERYRAVAESMSKTDRATIRKYYAALRGTEYSNVGTAAALPDIQRWRDEARRLLLEVVKDKTTPGGEVYDACDGFFCTLPKKSKVRDEVYFELEPILFKNWPAEASLYLLKGWFYTEYAWEARGTARANAVTDQGWMGFGERLQIAEQALNTAWKLDPTDARVARQMLTVELGQGQGPDRMEKWFERAMGLNTNYYEACYAKLYYLEPKWHGSYADMFEFAGECLRSDKWGGNVPLVVLDAHESYASSLPKSERPAYWKRAEVWNDVKQAFDKFFRLNPQATGWHHNYARYAYQAEQWEELNRQLGLLGKVNYTFFGGKDEFDKMVQRVQEHTR